MVVSWRVPLTFSPSRYFEQRRLDVGRGSQLGFRAYFAILVTPVLLGCRKQQKKLRLFMPKVKASLTQKATFLCPHEVL
jgi:hypothetical protein